MFLRRLWQNFAENLTYAKRYSLPRISAQQPGRVTTDVTHKSLAIWGCIMDHQKAKRDTYQNGIKDFRSFSQSETRKF
jgi:hypothetical protein